jgi:hypothetical protein
MPERIPVAAAKLLAKKYACRQVIIAAWDGTRTHLVTYGVSVEEADMAALGGNLIAKTLGWPESLCDSEPSRVTKLRRERRRLLRSCIDMRRWILAWIENGPVEKDAQTLVDEADASIRLSTSAP